MCVYLCVCPCINICIKNVCFFYQALVEKDWLSFGHKFSDRCGYISSDGKELAPIFTQFIDATYQLLQQYPHKFQFNEFFLLTLHDHVHSCQYGTFIGNSEKERQTLRYNNYDLI